MFRCSRQGTLADMGWRLDFPWAAPQAAPQAFEFPALGPMHNALRFEVRMRDVPGAPGGGAETHR